MKFPFFDSRCLFLESVYKHSIIHYRALFKQHKEAWGIPQEALSLYPKGSIGRALSEFLDQDGFELQDKLESHDVYHILTGIGTSVPDEIAMQYCLLASGKKSLYGAFTIILGTTLIPEEIPYYYRSYVQGSKMANIALWDLKARLPESLAAAQEELWQCQATLERPSSSETLVPSVAVCLN